MKHLNVIRERAYAKINLFLDVLSTRPDGFHNIISVMHSLDLSDTLEISIKESEGVNVSLSTDSDLPTDINNLAYKAAIAYLERAGVGADVHIDLIKCIPVSAGLGGGSSDAAAVLRALNRHFRAFDLDVLYELALTIGSDVPYALTGGTAVCEGRGTPERFLTLAENKYFVLSKSNESIRAPEAYAYLDSKYLLPDGIISHNTDFSACPGITASYEGKDILIPLFNIFEDAVSERISDVSVIKDLLFELGADSCLMSGSGPTVFGVFNTKNAAENAVEELSSRGYYASCAVGAPNIIL